MRTFRGGIYPDENKATASHPIEKLPPPEFVSIPMSQSVGASCEPSVIPGDYVFVGQQIGDVPKGALGAPVHASVSGKVVYIDEKSSPNGARVKSVVIENDKAETLSPDIVPFDKKLSETSSDEIIEVVRRAGIVGMGGAAFPSWAKIKSALGKAHTLIINGCECEPYISVNHRLMLEKPASIINGVKILMKALEIQEAIIAVEDNKLDAAAKLNSILKQSKLIKVKTLITKYPQGDERQLIYSVSGGQELPAGHLPAELGYVIFNVETAAAVYRAFAKGLPLIDRVVTVDGGCVEDPRNLLVPIGTPIIELLMFCGARADDVKMLIAGGPMMGKTLTSVDLPITKNMAAVLAFDEMEVARQTLEGSCIRCGRCVANCPMHLMPNYLSMFARAGEYDRCEKYNVFSCVECGSCTYNCPGKVRIVQYIRVAKSALAAAKKAKKAGEAT